MARLFSSGFELNSATSGVEWVTSGSPTISATTVRSGSFAGRITSLTSGTGKYFLQLISTADGNGPFFVRFYLLIHTAPSANTTIFNLQQLASPFTQMIRLVLNTGRTISLLDEDGTIGTSSALTADQWYRIEIKFDRTASAGSHVVELKIDGVSSVSSTTRSWSAGVGNYTLGGNINGEAATTCDIFFDDFAINDSSGASQTGYPGAGAIVHMQPDSAGDNNDWAGTGGTAGATNNFGRVNEVTPDDVTTYNARTATGTKIDDFNCESATSAGIGASDTITLVAVGARIGATSGTATNRNGKLRIKSQASGTVLSSAAFSFALNGWSTNGVDFFNFLGSANPDNYKLHSYTDPQAGGAWTPSLLGTMQIGYTNNESSANAIRVSAIWALVEYVAATGSAYTQGLTESVTLSDTLLRSGGKLLSETLTHTDALIRAVARALLETVTLTDTVLKQAGRALIETITHTDVLSKGAGKALPENLTYSDTLIRGVGKLCTEAITWSDALLKQLARALSETVTWSDSLSISSFYSLILDETITLTDTVLRSSARVLSETLTFTDSCVRQVARILTESITLSDVLAKRLARSLSDPLMFSDTLIRSAGKALDEIVTLSDTVVRQVTRSLSEVVMFTDELMRQAARTLIEDLALTDLLARSTSRTLTEDVTLTDQLTRGAARILEEVLSLEDAVTRQLAKMLTEAVTLSDTVLARAATAFQKGSTVLLSIARGAAVLAQKASATVLGSRHDATVLESRQSDDPTALTSDRNPTLL